LKCCLLGVLLKTWIQKIAEQFETDWVNTEGMEKHPEPLAEERGTLLFVLDAYSKYMFDTDAHPARKSREAFDQIMKELLKNNPEKNSKILFRIRQSFSSHRMEESTYVQKTFDDFRNIIWEFVDHMGEELNEEKKEDQSINNQLIGLRDAVESNSIEALKKCSREFIHLYSEIQTHREKRKEKKISSFKKNIQTIRKKLNETEDQVKKDHLTGAFNRKAFHEVLRQQWSLHKISQSPVSLIAFDIDHFKKINDSYGHDMGDYILKEFVKILNETFHIENQTVCRVGGEEFIVILPNYKASHSIEKATELLERVRKEVFVNGESRIQFTVSAGIAELSNEESIEQWVKRSDVALYNAKMTGRNKFVVSDGAPFISKAS